MASVQVILREDVAKLGKTGQLVRVKPGYARNYLVPRGLAVVATEGNITQIEHEKKAALTRAAKLRKSAVEAAALLGTVEITIHKSVGEEDKLYGSVTAREIGEALEAKGHPVEKKKIVLESPIKQLGTHDVHVKLGPDVSAIVKVHVVRKE